MCVDKKRLPHFYFATVPSARDMTMMSDPLSFDDLPLFLAGRRLYLVREHFDALI